MPGPGTEYFDDDRVVDPCSNLGEYALLELKRPFRLSELLAPFSHLPSIDPRRPRRVRLVKCTFTGGEVEGVVVDHEVFQWICPVCFTENQVDVSRDYDPEEM